MFDAPARRVLAVRLGAVAAGDSSLVAECDLQLARWGIDPDNYQTAVPAEPVRRQRTRGGKPVEG